MANRLTKLLPASAVDVPCTVAVSKADRREQEQRERRYRAEDALRCLLRAEEIRRDHALMKDVVQIASEQKKSLQRITPSGRR
jgi:hypothetical protein